MAYEVVACTKKAFIENFANFSGRTNRHDFWYAILGYIVISFLVGLGISLVVMGIGSLGLVKIINYIYYPILAITFIPSLALEVRRLHDLNKSGWWVLLEALIIGTIVLIYWFCQDSVDKNNSYK